MIDLWCAPSLAQGDAARIAVLEQLASMNVTDHTSVHVDDDCNLVVLTPVRDRRDQPTYQVIPPGLFREKEVRMGQGEQGAHAPGQTVSDVARELRSRGHGHRERRQLVSGALPFHIQVIFDSSFDGIAVDDPRKTAFSDAAVSVWLCCRVTLIPLSVLCVCTTTS